MVLLELFWSFLKIGFTSFGGLSMIPLINDEVLSHGWMTASEVADIVAIAEMTPGPLGFNCATFAGIQAAGIPGAIAANLGVMSPTLTLCAAAAVFFERVKGNKYMEHILVGVRPACLGMVVGVTCSMLTNYLGASGQVSLPAGIAPEGKAERPGGHRDQRPAGAAVFRRFGLAVARPAWYNGGARTA